MEHDPLDRASGDHCADNVSEFVQGHHCEPAQRKETHGKKDLVQTLHFLRTDWRVRSHQASSSWLDGLFDTVADSTRFFVATSERTVVVFEGTAAKLHCSVRHRGLTITSTQCLAKCVSEVRKVEVKPFFFEPLRDHKSAIECQFRVGAEQQRSSNSHHP